MTQSWPLADEAWLRAAWTSAWDAMALSDPEGLVLAANPAYYALYGYSPEEVLGQSFAVIFSEEARAWAEQLYQEIFHGPAVPEAYESIVRLRDGTERVVESRASFVEEDGRRVAMLSIVRDVTDRVAAREAVARAERDQRAFLSSVTHDLKNPLASIRGHAQLLRRRFTRPGAPSPSSAASADVVLSGLSEIETSVAQMANLIDEVFEIASVATGVPPALNVTSTDLVQLAQEAVTRHQRLADHHTIALDTDVAALRGSWDAQRLNRVLDNLISNAIKYSPEGGRVTVSIAPAERPSDGPGLAFEGQVRESTMLPTPPGALLRVTDEGIGITPADLPLVFEPFRRGSNVGASTPGSGVGLTSVKHIVEQHGGSVAISNGALRGTVVSIWLPLEPPSPPQPAPAVEERHATSGDRRN